MLLVPRWRAEWPAGGRSEGGAPAGGAQEGAVVLIAPTAPAAVP